MRIREATVDDLRQVDAICDASGRERWTPKMVVPARDRTVLAAIVDDGIAGIAKTHFHGEPEGGAPGGHYLGGVIVSPDHRRRGIGFALTRARLEWIWDRSSTAFELSGLEQPAC